LNAYDRLAARPDEFVKILDNDEAQELLVFCGLGGGFIADSKRPRFVQYATCNRHPTHWILFGRYTNHPNPRDNGYTATCLPKSKYNLEQAQAVIDRFIAIAMPNIEGGYRVDANNPKN